MEYLKESWAIIALFLTIGVNILLVLLNFRLKKKEIVFESLKEIQFEFIKEWYLIYVRTIRRLDQFQIVAYGQSMDGNYKRRFESELNANIDSYLDNIALLKLVIDNKYAAILDETTKLIGDSSSQLRGISRDVQWNKLNEEEIVGRYEEVKKLLDQIIHDSKNKIEPIMRKLMRQE